VKAFQDAGGVRSTGVDDVEGMALFSKSILFPGIVNDASGFGNWWSMDRKEALRVGKGDGEARESSGKLGKAREGARPDASPPWEGAQVQTRAKVGYKSQAAGHHFCGKGG
jgi:hypothetical protein